MIAGVHGESWVERDGDRVPFRVHLRCPYCARQWHVAFPPPEISRHLHHFAAVCPTCGLEHYYAPTNRPWPGRTLD